MTRDVPVSWLGNHSAFAAYQRYYLSSGGLEGLDALTRMIGAMNSLLEGDHSFPDVGDFPLSVGSREHGLVYLPSAHATFPPDRTSSEEWRSVEMGTASTGAYAYSVLCPTASGIPLVAVYVTHGGFGIVFAPLQGREPIVIDASDAMVFVRTVEATWGYELSGMVQVGGKILRLRRHAPGTT